MAIQSCLNVSDPSIKKLVDIYGEVAAEKIISRAGENIPTEQEAKEIAVELDLDPVFASKRTDSKPLNAQEINDLILERANMISDEFATDPNTGELRYQTTEGRMVKQRFTDLAKRLWKGKRSEAETKEENERPNNKLLRETGTTLHRLMQGLVYERAMKSDVLTPSVRKGYKPTTDKPAFLTNEAYQSVVKAADKMVESYEKRQTKLNNKTGKTEKATVHLEMILFDTAEKAGTPDIMIVYSDAAVAVFDHKFTRPEIIKRVGPNGKPIYEESLELPDVKRKGFRLQMSEIRKMLRDKYGIENSKIINTTIYPYFMDITRSETEYEDGTKIQKGNPDNKRVKLLPQVTTIKGIGDSEVTEKPSGYELTDNPAINKILLKLFSKLEKTYIDAAKNYYSNPELSQKASQEAHQLEKVIEELTLEKDVGSIIQYVNNVSDWVLENSDKIEPADLTQLYKEMKYYEDIIGSIASMDRLLTADEMKNEPELLKEIARNNLLIGDAFTNIRNTTLLLEEQIIVKLEQINPDIRRQSKRNLTRYLEYFSEIDDPIFSTAYNLITDQENVIKKKLDSLIEEIKEWGTKLKAVGIQTVYNKLIDKDTGNLIPRLSREFKKKEREAEDNNDVAVLKNMYKVTDEGRKKYEEDYKRVKTNYDILYKNNPEMKELKLSQWVASNNLDKSDSAWVNRWARYKYSVLKNEDAYLSEEYKNLDPIAKEFYDWYFNKMKEFDKMVPERIRGNFIPNVKRNAIELLEDGLSMNTPAQVMQIIKNNTTHMLQLRKSDYQQIQGDPNAEDITPPLLYMDNFEHWDKDLGDFVSGYKRSDTPIEKSTDLLYNLALFGESVIRKNAMSEISETLDSLRAYVSFKPTMKKDLLGNVKTDDFTGQPELEIDARNLDDFNKLLRMQVRKESIVTEDKLIKIGKKTYSTNRIISTVTNLARHNALAFNWLPALAGGLNGLANVFAYSAKNKLYTRKNLNKAIVVSASNRPVFAAINHYLAPEKENYAEREARKATKGFFAKHVNMDAAYAVYRVPEEYNSNLIAVSTSMNHGIDPVTKKMRKLSELPEGTKSIYDIMASGVVDGKVDAEILPQEVYNELRRKSRSASRLVKGTNTALDKSLAQGTLSGQVLLMFRNWIQPMVQTRFGDPRYEPTLETVEIGRARVAFKELLGHGKLLQRKTVGRIIHQTAMSLPLLGNMLQKSTNGAYKVDMENSLTAYEQFLKNNPQHKGRITIDEFHQARQAEMQSFFSEMRTFVIIAGMMALLTMDSDEDGERDSANNPFSNLVYTLTERFQTEMAFFYNPAAFQEISRDAVPLSFFLGKVYNLFSNTFDEIGDNLFTEDELTVAGNSMDKTEEGHYFFRLFPTFAPIQRLIDVIYRDVYDDLDSME